MTDDPPVAQTLAALAIPHRIYRHGRPVRSLEQAAAERAQQPNQVVRSILFRISSEEFVMVLMAGPAQIDWRALRQHLGQSRLTMASEEEVLRVTGYERGAVAPFGLPHPVRTLVDKSVLAQDEVSLGSGVRGTAVILTVNDLLRALGSVEIGQFGELEQEE